MNHISLAKKAGFDVICKVTWTSNEKVLCKVTHRARQVLAKLWESMHPGMKLLMGQDSRVSFMFSVDDSVTLVHD